MNRLNLLFFAFLISFIHNFYSEFNTIFLQSFLFLFFSELISVKLFNRFRNQTNQQNQNDDNSSSNTEEEETVEDTIETVEKTTETEGKTAETVETTALETEKKEGSEETPEESDSETGDSDEPVDITDGVDVSQMEILRLLNNYESLGDSGLMELKNKMLELDKLVEFYKNDTKKTKKE
jgi:hypothetical protein